MGHHEILCYLDVGRVAEIIWVLMMLGWFIPMWLTIFYYLVPEEAKILFGNGLLVCWLLSVVLIILNEFVFIGIRAGLLNVLIWQFMFGAITYIMIEKRYKLHYACFIAFVTTLLATEIWEIPIHILTISMNPTLEQFLNTFMLSSPYLVLIVPFLCEMKRKGIFKRSNSHEFHIMLFIGLPALFSSIFVFFHDKLNIFQPTGYPLNELNYALRLVFVFFFIVSVLGFPKVKSYEGGYGNS